MFLYECKSMQNEFYDPFTQHITDQLRPGSGFS